jgi:hypothetical protein
MQGEGLQQCRTWVILCPKKHAFHSNDVRGTECLAIFFGIKVILVSLASSIDKLLTSTTVRVIVPFHEQGITRPGLFRKLAHWK